MADCYNKIVLLSLICLIYNSFCRTWLLNARCLLLNLVEPSEHVLLPWLL
jgi:hypothetical protein